MKIIKKAIKSTALKQSALMVFGNTLASAISAIALIIYSRFLGPEKYGIFSIGFSTILLLSKLADGGVNVATQRQTAQIVDKSKKDAKKLIHSGLKIKTAITFLVVLIFFIFSKPLAIYWLKTDHVEVIQMAILISVVNVSYDYIAIIHQSLRRFSDSVIMSISQAFTKAAFAISIWFAHIRDPFIAFILYSISPLVGVGFGFARLPKWLKSKETVSKKHTKSLLSIMKFTSIAVMASAIGDNIDVLLVKSYLTNYETGLYSAGARLSILISIIGYSLGTVLNPRVARYKSISHFKKFAAKAMIISIIAIISIGAVMPLTKLFIIITAGKEYLPATQAVSYLLAAGLFAVATTPFVSMFYTIEKPSYFAISGIVQTITLVLANLYLIPQFGINGAGMSKLIMRVVTLIFTVIFANWAIKKTYKKGLFSIIFSK
ncbi:lipopolysaccharide biosynthesis protein [Patescibacteria group bacterium]